MNSYNFHSAAQYFRDKLAFTTGAHELEVMVNRSTGSPSVQVVDVRYPADFALGHVPGAINLPRGKWRPARGLDRNVPVYVYCYNPTCHLATEAAIELIEQGYQVVEVEGGWDTWVENGFGIEVTAKSA